MVWKADGPEGRESAKIRWELVPYTRGKGLDLGCGDNKGFPHFIGVDNCTDNELGRGIKPDVKANAEKLDWQSQSMDFVFSAHLLEHLEDYKAVLREWFRVVKVGGHLVLYLPHKDFYPKKGEPGANQDHKHDFHPNDIIAAMEELPDGWDLLENQERNEDLEYSFFQVYKKLGHKARKRSCDLSKPEKTVAVVRYGAFGDLMMVSSIFPQLKADGYHITLYTSNRGHEVIHADPHIDRIILQDTDQVPNAALGDFLKHEAKKYDKLINLNESVEGVFLALPERVSATLPKEARHRIMNVNYVEFAHLVAGYDCKPAQRFYASKEEKDWAAKVRKKIGGSFVVLWSLSGSAVHKAWPHMDTILARLLIENKDVRIVLVGDQAGKLLERGWENEPRVWCRSGEWDIRHSFAFLEHCDLIIGSETGVMNAAALLPVPKIVTLSHSTRENLTRDWVNTTSLEPQNTPCYPCHKMHYSFDTCAEGFMAHPEKPGELIRVGSLCQVNISPEQMWDAIVPHLLKRQAA